MTAGRVAWVTRPRDEANGAVPDGARYAGEQDTAGDDRRRGQERDQQADLQRARPR
jgi:hypothetical protein